MNKVRISVLKSSRSTYSRTRRRFEGLGNILGLNFQSPQPNHPGLPIDYSGQAASDAIRSLLSTEAPCMVARFGSNELNTLCCYLNIQRKSKFPLEKTLSYITEQTPEFWWSDRLKHNMGIIADFFPTTDQCLEKFARRMLEDMENIDILGSWRREEFVVQDKLSHIKVVRLEELRPWEHLNPWSEVLEDKKVLVVHPFETSIKNQYLQRERLFKDQRVLPRFELKTFKAVQSIAGNSVGFVTWFEALDWMCEKISNIEFDIAIIGAGAYGLSLAAFVKQMGKKSVHLGGVTQLFFGIKGKRWEEQGYLQKIGNEYWVRPLPSEVPDNFQSVERGSYW